MSRQKCLLVMLMLDAEIVYKLRNSRVLFVCEGSAERVITETLLEADKLIVSSKAAIRDSIEDRPTTICRNAKKIQEAFLSYDYESPVAIVRMLDSLKERFKLSYPFNEQVPVYSFYTRPEIEMLAIIKEGKTNQYNKSKLKPSEYCKKQLGLPDIKQERFLQDYWSDPEELCRCIWIYEQRHKRKNDNEYSLADLLK